MKNGDGLRELGDLIDRLESDGLCVNEVRPVNETLTGQDGIAVEITISLDRVKTVVEGPESGSATLHGELPTCTFEVTLPPGDSPGTREQPDAGTSEHGEGATSVAVEASSSVAVSDRVTEAGAAASAENDAAGADAPQSADRDDQPGGSSRATTSEAVSGDDEDVPYYENVDRLAEVYENHDTFAEMTRALGVDVTPATVRHHMVDQGLHPGASADEDDGSAGAYPRSTEPIDTVKTDGLGLPDGIALEQLVGTVKRAQTFYEVRTDLGIDAESARNLLAELDLLGLVLSRLATKGEKDITEEEVYERIRASRGR